MPKQSAAAKSKNAKSFKETLWGAANKLRGSVESSEYKYVALSLVFLKFVSDKFEERRAELVAYLDMAEFYTMQNAFYLPETSRWSYIQRQAMQGDIAIKIDSATRESENLFFTRSHTAGLMQSEGQLMANPSDMQNLTKIAA